MSKFFPNTADKNACFLINCKILVTRKTEKTEKQTLLLAQEIQTGHDCLVWKKILSVKLGRWERKFAYLFINDQWKLSRNKSKSRVLKFTKS